ncbi:ABC transporter permease [Miltoncostaea marina]|uniref:ABC transporter permease n=1 Tax=Miltoncostaea marina TaxID=2843215 RepID=UPI001C3E2A80|nr:ABC transporter permease [Miltoncostaea marina]
MSPGEVWDAFREQDGWGQLWLHVRMSLAALGLATVTGLVLGVICAKIGRVASFLVVSVSNLGRTVPTFALIALILALTSLGFWPAALGLFALGVPPILINAYTGVREVDPGAVEASRGMGFTPLQVLTRVELPMALPLVFAGVRTSAVQIIATAALAGLVGAGGLGVILSSGLSNSQEDVILAGAIPVTLLAILAELLFGAAERLVTPRGLRLGRGPTTR